MKKITYLAPAAEYFLLPRDILMAADSPEGGNSGGSLFSEEGSTIKLPPVSLH